MRARRAAPYAILALGAALVLVPHWPGRLHADSNGMLEGVRGELPIVDHWTATLTWAWRQGHLLVDLDVGGVFLLQTVALIVGVYLVLRAVFGRIAAATLAVLVLLSPPTVGFISLVGRDMWFVAGCVLAAGLAVAAVRWTGRGPRSAALGGGLAAAAVAITARQNAFVAVAPVLVGLAVPALALARERGVGIAWGRRRTALVAVALGLVATFAISVASTLSDRATRDFAFHPEVITYLYDLGYLTLATDQQLIPALPRDVLPVQSQEEVRQRWQPSTALYMRADPDGEGPQPGSTRLVLSDAEVSSVARAWRTALLEHPRDYLWARFSLWRRQLGIGFTPGFTRARTDYHPAAFSSLSTAASGYSRMWGTGSEPSTVGGPAHHAWLYLLVCLLGLALLLPRYSLAIRVAATLSAAAVGLQVGLFFFAPSIQWRYQLLTVYAALIVLALVAGLAVQALSSGKGNRAL